MLPTNDRERILLRFLRKVNKNGPGGCWLWAAAETWSREDKSDVYGSFCVNGRTKRAHRVAYELFIGQIPAGLTIDHVAARGCTSKLCVNPAHLEAVTNRENLLRADTIVARCARRTSCKHGHEFSGENLTIRSDGSRRCVECSKRWSREKSAREKAARERAR